MSHLGWTMMRRISLICSVPSCLVMSCSPKTTRYTSPGLWDSFDHFRSHFPVLFPSYSIFLHFSGYYLYHFAHHCFYVLASAKPWLLTRYPLNHTVAILYCYLSPDAVSSGQHPARSNQSPSASVMEAAAVLHLQGDLRENVNSHNVILNRRVDTLTREFKGLRLQYLPRPAMGASILSIHHPVGIRLDSRCTTSKNYKHITTEMNSVLHLMPDICHVTHHMLPEAAGGLMSAS